MNKYVVACMSFKNLPPKLGIFAERNQADVVWQSVSAEIMYVFCSENGSIITFGNTNFDSFGAFLEEHNIFNIVHTSGSQGYYYSAMMISRGNKVCMSCQHLLDLSLSKAGKISKNENFNHHFKNFGGPIMDYLMMYSPMISGFLSILNWDKFIKKVNKPVSKAEYLHSLHSHMPNPIGWVYSNYCTEEKNEYSEFMSRFNFVTYGSQSPKSVYKIIKKLN